MTLLSRKTGRFIQEEEEEEGKGNGTKGEKWEMSSPI
jgi:hypothetical protein